MWVDIQKSVVSLGMGSHILLVNLVGGIVSCDLFYPYLKASRSVMCYLIIIVSLLSLYGGINMQTNNRKISAKFLEHLLIHYLTPGS